MNLIGSVTLGLRSQGLDGASGRAAALILVLSGLGSACGGGSAPATVEFRKPVSDPNVKVASAKALTLPVNYSFTPTVFKVPVKEVSLKTDSGDLETIVSCSGSDAECAIDFADQASLDALAANAAEEFSTGTYVEGSFSLCTASQGLEHTIYVKGSWTEGGTTYYTTSNSSDPVSTDVNQWGETAVPINTCKLNMKFSSSLVVEADKAVKITLFPIISGVGYFRTDSTETYASCANGTNEAVCINYPNLIPYVGSGEGFLESYSVRPKSGGANTVSGLVHLLVDASGNAFGGMTLKYLRPSSDTDTIGWGFGQAIKKISKSSETTLSWETYGSNPSTERYGYLNWTTFTRIATIGSSNDQSFQISRNGSSLEAATECTVYRIDPESL